MCLWLGLCFLTTLCFWRRDMPVAAHPLTQPIPIQTHYNISHLVGIKHGYLKGVLGVKRAL